MANNRPDPGEFFEMAQRMLRELFGDQRSGGDDPWAEATRRPRERSEIHQGREPSPKEQRENLTFALATRGVEALEDLALNVAAIRQRLERQDPQPSGRQPQESRAGTERTPPGGESAADPA